MDLFETTQTIKKWINSCSNAAQLDLCVEVIMEFVTKRFEGVVPAYDLMNEETELANLVYNRRIILAATPSNTLPIGDNSRHDENKISEL